MTDIKLTLSKKSNRAPSIEAEARWMEAEGPIFYPLGANRPRDAEPGCWVYFIRDGRLVARSRAKAFVRSEEGAEMFSYSGDPVTSRSWRVQCSRMELAAFRPRAEGFQGFRYVHGAEQAMFERAFLPTSAEEVVEPQRYREGALRTIPVNAYEREPAARSACIAQFGTACMACGTSLGEVFGPVADGVIHVHHRVPLADIGQEYVVDPVRDLVPVCPNCHTIIHLRHPPYSIEEVQEMLRREDAT